LNKPNPKTAAVNRTLFADLRQHEQAGNKPGAIQSRKSLVEANMRLIYWYANRYRWVVDEGRMEMGDLIGAGVVGMYQAIEKFDMDKGFMFSTYARHWIRSYIDRAAQGGEVVRKYHGWMSRGSIISLDAPIKKDRSDSMIRHEVIDSLVETPEAVVADLDEIEVIGQACQVVGKQMGGRASVAMVKRFKDGKTYREIGEDVGLTKQAIHFMEKRFVRNVQRELKRTG